MTFVTSLALGWQRAQQIDRTIIQPLDPGRCAVPSSRAAALHTVRIAFDPTRQLVAASRTSPELRRRRPRT